MSAFITVVVIAAAIFAIVKHKNKPKGPTGTGPAPSRPDKPGHLD